MSTTDMQIVDYRASQIRTGATDAGFVVTLGGQPVDFTISKQASVGSHLAVSLSYRTGEITVARVMSGGHNAGVVTFDRLALDMVVDAIVAIAQSL